MLNLGKDKWAFALKPFISKDKIRENRVCGVDAGSDLSLPRPGPAQGPWPGRVCIVWGVGCNSLLASFWEHLHVLWLPLGLSHTEVMSLRVTLRHVPPSSGTPSEEPPTGGGAAPSVHSPVLGNGRHFCICWNSGWGFGNIINTSVAPFGAPQLHVGYQSSELGVWKASQFSCTMSLA